MRTRPPFLAAFGLAVAVLAGAADAATYTVRGQVVTGAGALAGAEVELIHHPIRRSPWPGEEPGSEAAETVRVESGADGRFEIAVDLDGIRPELGEARWLLEISAPGLARRILDVPPHGDEARAGSVSELGGLLLAPGAAVRGRVVATAAEATGATLAGVRVALWRAGLGAPRPWTATSAADGSFEIADVPPGDYVAVLEHEGFAARRLDRVMVFAGRPPGDVDLGTLTLPRPLAVGGAVVDAAGEPLAGVRVRLRELVSEVDPDRLPIWHATTDAEGRFRLDAVPPDLDEVLFAFDKPGFRRRSGLFETVPDGDGRRLAELVEMRRELVLAGRVVDQEGEPVAEAGVERAGETGHVMSGHQTDASGGFRLPVVKAGSHRVRIWARGFLNAEAEIDATAGPPAAPVEILLERDATTDVAILVRDAGGDPVARAQLYFGNRGEGLTPYHELGHTDGTGRGAFHQVPVGGSYSLEVRHPEHPRLWRRDFVVTPGRNLLEVVLDPAPWKLVEVRGTVVDGHGTPQPGVEVALEPAPFLLLGGQRTRTDAEGAFELRRVKEGGYRLTATAPGWAVTALPLSVAEELAPLEVTLTAGATLEGRVRGLGPPELKGLRIYAWEHRVSDMREGAVDGDRYVIRHLGAGTWQVTAAAADSQLEAQVEIEPGQTEARLDFDFPEGHRVRGRLLIDGEPPPRHSMLLETLRGEPQVQTYQDFTDPEGRFAFDATAPGAYRLWTMDETGSVQRQLVVASDTELVLDLRTHRLRGRVVDVATGEGVGEAPVSASPEIVMSHGPRWETATDAGGWFELGPLIEGPWTIFVQAEGYLREHHPLQLGGGDPVVVELIPSAGLHVRVETASGRLPYSVELVLRDAGGEPGAGSEPVARGSATLAPDGTGHWRDAPPGRYRLFADNDVIWIETEVEIPGPPAVLRFPAAGALRLRVPELELESEGAWNLGVPLRVEATLTLPEDPDFTEPTVRRSRRPFLRGLAPGSWRLELRVEDGRVWTGEGQVFDGRTSEVILSTRR